MIKVDTINLVEEDYSFYPWGQIRKVFPA